jgi:hypothetical protein
MLKGYLATPPLLIGLNITRTTLLRVDRKTVARPNLEKPKKKTEKWAVWIGLRVNGSGNSVYT